MVFLKIDSREKKSEVSHIQQLWPSLNTQNMSVPLNLLDQHGRPSYNFSETTMLTFFSVQILYI